MQLDLEVKQELQQRFIFKSLLGKGSFGAVYQCQDKRDNEIYAVKIISKSNVKKSKMKCLREEARLLSSINHTNIVKVYEFVETDTFIYLRMEFIKNGTLQKFIKNRWQSGKKFTDQQMATIMKSIFQSLHYIHSINIIHRDIKPQNILIPCLDDLSQIKMADFGLSTKLDFFYPKTATSKCGTMLFMAPQILNNLSYSKSVDIWSCSIILYLLAKGKHPFYKSKMTTQQYKTKIKTIIFQSISDRLANDFLQRISKVDPNERYTTQQALKHPWLTRNMDDQIPQSLHQAFLGFQKSHSIANLFKLCITTKYLLIENSNTPNEIPDTYITKKNNQTKIIHDLNSRRGCKTSWRKQRGNTSNQQNLDNSKSMKTMVAQSQTIDKDSQKNQQQTETQSPAIIKLNKIFDALLDRKNKKKQPRFYTETTKTTAQTTNNNQNIKNKLITEVGLNSPIETHSDISNKNYILPSINKENTADKSQKIGQRAGINGSFITRSKNQSLNNGGPYNKNTFYPMTPCYKRAQKQSPPKFIQHKEKLEKQIQRLVREYKMDNQIDYKDRTERNKRRKMLPENKRELSNKNSHDENYISDKKQFRIMSQKQSISSSGGSTYSHKVRYRKKTGSALRLYD